MVDRFQRERMYRTPGVLARRSCTPARNHGLLATVDVREASDSDGLLRTRSTRPRQTVRR
jgi:hypothetical protein